MLNKYMLSHERYLQSLVGLERLGAEGFEVDERTRQRLLVEQYATQTALARLGVCASDSPGCVPEINRLLLPDDYVEQERMSGVLIEVWGMPNSLKTTSLRNSSLRLPFIEMVGEFHYETEAFLDRHASYPEMHAVIKQYFQTGKRTEEIWKIFSDYRNTSEQKEHDYPIVVAERGRGPDQLAFDRANFLDGQMELEVFERLSDFHSLPLEFSVSDIRYGFINCMVTPEMSLMREGPRETSGRVMNNRFLPILYEQYLRLHYEMISKWGSSDEKRSCAYAGIDMSDPDYEKNIQLFHETLGKMIAGLTSGQVGGARL